MNTLLDQLNHFPTNPGVYLMKNAHGKIIYIGKAKNLKMRIRQYFAQSGDTRPMIPFLIEQTTQIDTIVVPSEKEALLLESTLIKKHQPKFNAVLKDDKTFVSLMINHKHQWPKLQLIRCKGKPHKENLYFGPYTSAFAARKTYELLSSLFPLRQCSDLELKQRTRPCILHAIKRCCAPCVNLCTQEEYHSYVEGAIHFLKGHDKQIVKQLYIEMESAASLLNYEQAATLLKKIKQIEHVIHAEQIVSQNDGKDTDALNIYRQGEEVLLLQLLFREGNLIGSEYFSFSQVLEDDDELLTSFILQHYPSAQTPPQDILLPCLLKERELIREILQEYPHLKTCKLIYPQKGEKQALVQLAKENAITLFMQKKDQQILKEKMLLDLQDILKLNAYPQLIECFDTSNLSGADPVAAMVRFTNGEKDPQKSRLFKIKLGSRSDDYAAIKEVLIRHLTRAQKEDKLPDLIIIDGGKGHLNIALDVLKQLNIISIDAIGLAKESSRHDRGITQEKIYLPTHHDPILLNPRSSILFLLQQIRDETHRKAIQFQRKSRRKKLLTGQLDGIPGIGPTKKKALLKHFGSVQQISLATQEELEKIPYLTQKDIINLKKLIR